MSQPGGGLVALGRRHIPERQRSDRNDNRQGDKDRLRAENDFQVNLKTEFIIEDLHHKLEEALMGQQELHEALEALTAKIERSGGSHETDAPSL